MNLGWFSTGRDEAALDLLRAIHAAIQRGEIPATEIVVVFCNRERGEFALTDRFLDLVAQLQIPWVTFSSARFQPELRKRDVEAWRVAFDREVMRRLAPFAVDLWVLAGYMLIVSPLLCQKYPLINLHPALPGREKGSWQEVIHQLIAQEAEDTGCMMHLVTPELDAGPPITYCRFSLREEPFASLWEEKGETLFWEIRQHGFRRELPLLVETLKLFACGEIKIESGQVKTAAGEVLEGGYDLTAEIDRRVKV